MEQSEKSPAANGSKFSSDELDSTAGLSFIDTNGSSNFLVSIGSSPSQRRRDGQSDDKTAESEAAGSLMDDDEFLEELVQRTLNMPLNLGNITEEFPELGEVDSAQFGRNPESALYDPLNNSMSFTRPSMNSAISMESTRGEMTRYFERGSGPLGSLGGAFNLKEPMPFSAYVRPRAPSDESNGDDVRQIPLVTSAMMDQEETVAPTVRVSSATSRSMEQKRPRATAGSKTDVVSIQEKKPMRIQSSCQASVYSSTMMTDASDLTTDLDEGLPERYLCVDLGTKEGQEETEENMENDGGYLMPTQSTPKNPGLDRETPMSFEENFSIIENTYCGMMPSRPPSGESRMSTLEQESVANPSPPERDSLRDGADTRESNDRSTTPASSAVTNRPWTSGPVWDGDQGAVRISDTNSTLTQGSSNSSGESGAGYIVAGLLNGPAHGPAYTPDVIHVPDRICAGVRADVIIPIVNVTSNWLHCSPTSTSIVINGEALADCDEAISFPKHVVTVKPGGRTTFVAVIICDRTGTFEAVVGLELGEVVQGMPGGRSDSPRTTRFIKKVTIHALVDAPQIELEPLHPDLMEESVLNLGCFPERCDVNEKILLKNGSPFRVPVRVWLEGREAFTRLFQLIPSLRNPTDARAQSTCPGFTTDLTDNEGYEFLLFLKTPTLKTGVDGAEYPSIHVNVRLIVDLNEPGKKVRRLAAMPVVCVLGVARPLLSLTGGSLRIPCYESRAFSIRNAGNVVLRLAVKIELQQPPPASPSDIASLRARPPIAIGSVGSESRGVVSGVTWSPPGSSYASYWDERSCFTVSPKHLDFLPEEEKTVYVSFHPPPSYSTYGAAEVNSVLHLMIEPNGQTFFVSLFGVPQPTSGRSSLVSGNNRIPAGRDALRWDHAIPYSSGSGGSRGGSPGFSRAVDTSDDSKATTAVTVRAVPEKGESAVKPVDAMAATPETDIQTVKANAVDVDRKVEPRMITTKHMLLQDPSIIQQFSKDTRREVALASACEVMWQDVSPTMWMESNFARLKLLNNSKRDSVLFDLTLLYGSNCEFFFVSENGTEYSKERQFLYLPADSSYMLRLYCRIGEQGDIPYYRGQLKMKTAHPDMRGRPLKFTINLTAIKAVKSVRIVDLANEDVTCVYLRSEDAADKTIRGTFFLQNPNEKDHCYVLMDGASVEGVKVKIEPECYLLSPKEVKCFYVSAPSRKEPLRNFGSITLLSGLESLRRAALKAECSYKCGGILVTQPCLREHWSPLGRLQEPPDQHRFPAPPMDVLIRALDGVHKRTLSLVYGDLDSTSVDRTLVPYDESTFFQSTESFLSPTGPPAGAVPPMDSFVDKTTNITREIPVRSSRTWDVNPVALRFDTGQVLVKPLEVRNWMSSPIRVTVENNSEDGLVVRPPSGTVAGSSSFKFLVDISHLNPSRQSNLWKLKLAVGDEKKQVSVMVSPFVLPEPSMASSTSKETMSSAYSEYSGCSDISAASRVRAGLQPAGDVKNRSGHKQAATVVLMREACDFGECALGGSLEENVPFRIDGAAVKMHWKVEPPKGYGEDKSTLAFLCRTPSGKLPPGQTGELIFQFEPVRAVSYASSWTLTCRLPDGTVEKVEIPLSGRGRDARQPLPRQPAASETSVARSTGLTDSAVSSFGGVSNDVDSKTKRSSRDVSCFQDMSVGSVKTPSSDSTLLELDRNIIEFPVVKLGATTEPIHAKLRLTNHSKTSFELKMDPMPEPFRCSPLPTSMAPRRFESFLITFDPKEKGIFQCVWAIKAAGRHDISPLRVKLFGKAV